MSDSITYPAVDEALFSEVVRRIRAVSSPDKIILFGSHARGEAREDSDLDILVVEPSALERCDRSPRYYAALRGLHFAKDIIVWTPDEVREWSNVANHFITTAVREGRILYER